MNIRTQEYLAAIVTSPQAQMYQPTDWMRVRDLLIMKDMFYRNQSDPVLSLKLSSEIRQLEAGLLFTHSDRVKAGVKIKPAIKGEVTKTPPSEDDVLDGVF
ncbi:hypothetical protein O1L55_20665 [Streptomyces albulus]|nr:hypothetical protein [Streptomyces noursei]